MNISMKTVCVGAIFLLSISSIGFAQDKDPNAFLRLMKSKSDRNPPLAKDGIHDPDSEGVSVLQSPKSAFDVLVKGKSGNYVDWVKSMDSNKINPRVDLKDENAKSMPMDLKIVREVKGSMPDVIFPHKQHTQWLECSNCHPAIFVPKKGANQMSMAEIILGKKCGVCHGKVAFPISECRLCHSVEKKVASKESKTTSSKK